MKKILVLNGSPRKNGNTSALIERFCAGAEDAGNKCTIFHIDNMNINGCKGCFGCDKNKDYPCVQKDDMEKIYLAYREADVIVFASPLYYWHLSGQIMTVLNRMLAVMRTDTDYSIDEKESVLLMAAEGYDFDLAINYYNSLTKYLGWRDRGSICVGGVRDPKDIDNNKELYASYKLGMSI